MMRPLIYFLLLLTANPAVKAEEDGLAPQRSSPEFVVLVEGEVVYRGRIDDQYTPGTNRTEPTRRDLELAIQEVLAGCAVSVMETPATGCHISIPTASNQSETNRGTERLTFGDI